MPIHTSNFLLKLSISEKGKMLISDVEPIVSSDQATVTNIPSNADSRKF